MLQFEEVDEAAVMSLDLQPASEFERTNAAPAADMFRRPGRFPRLPPAVLERGDRQRAERHARARRDVFRGCPLRHAADPPQPAIFRGGGADPHRRHRDQRQRVHHRQRGRHDRARLPRPGDLRPHHPRDRERTSWRPVSYPEYRGVEAAERSRCAIWLLTTFFMGAARRRGFGPARPPWPSPATSSWWTASTGRCSAACSPPTIACTPDRSRPRSSPRRSGARGLAATRRLIGRTPPEQPPGDPRRRRARPHGRLGRPAARHLAALHGADLLRSRPQRLRGRGRPVAQRWPDASRRAPRGRRRRPSSTSSRGSTMPTIPAAAPPSSPPAAPGSRSCTSRRPAAI